MDVARTALIAMLVVAAAGCAPTPALARDDAGESTVEGAVVIRTDAGPFACIPRRDVPAIPEGALAYVCAPIHLDRSLACLRWPARRTLACGVSPRPRAPPAPGGLRM